MFARIAGKEDPLGCWRILVLARGPLLPPLTQKAQNVARQHDAAIFATLRLHDADDLLSAVDLAYLESNDLACAHPAAISKLEHHPRLRARSHSEDVFDLLFAQHLRHLDRSAQTKNIGHQVVAPQRHAEQELHPRHDLVARANAGPYLDQILLKYFTSSCVVVSGERRSPAAKRLQACR